MSKRLKRQPRNYTHAVEIVRFEAELPLDDGERTLPIRFDEEVLEKAQDIFAMLLYARGVKTEIDGSDSEAALIARKQMRREKKRKLSPAEVQEILSGIRNVHTPHETRARGEAVTLAVIDSCDVLFEVRELPGGSVSIEPLEPYDDLEIPEDYFKPKKKSALRRVMENTGNMPVEPTVNPEHPMEVMLAYVSDLLEKNPNLNEQLQPYIERAFIGVRAGHARLDEEAEALFREALDAILLGDLDAPGDDEQREHAGGGTQDADEPSGEAV